MTSLTFQNSVLLLLLTFSLLLTLAVLYSFLIEKREGLSISYNRLYTSLASSLLLGIIGFFVLTVDLSSTTQKRISVHVQPITPTTKAPLSEASQDQIRKLEQRREVLQIQKSKIENEIAQLNITITQLSKRPNDTITQLSTPRHSPLGSPTLSLALNSWLVLLTLGILIFQTATIILTDDLGSLLPGWRWRRNGSRAREEKYREALKQLNQLAVEAQLDRYETGLRIVDRIEPALMSTLEQADYYYLKSFCTIQLLLRQYTTEGSGFPTPKDKAMMADTDKSLKTLLSLAPRMTEAMYLVGVLKMMQEEYQEAIDNFDKAQVGLGEKDVDFDNFISTCCLQLASNLLTQGNIDGADQLFRRVISIGIAADRVPAILLKNRLLQVRQHYVNREFEAARQALEAVNQISNLTQQQQQAIDIISESMNILLLDGEQQHTEALGATRTFLKKWTPADMPPPDELTADEFLFSSTQEEVLPFSAEAFCGFYFLTAVLQLQTQQGRLSQTQTDGITYSLLRALQFIPRHREVLAALGILYFYVNTDKRIKALEWLEASVAMGVFHPLVVQLVEKEKGREVKRVMLLDKFISLSLERLFARDISENMRKALLDEWGLFKEYHPALQEIKSTPKPEYAPITLQAVLNRAKYIEEFTSEVNSYEISEPSVHFKVTQERYGRLARQLQNHIQELTEVEKQILLEIGKQVLR
ncbi:tetratricopeptide repeat protein [Spirosoma sp.]|uniref:tetratricopeptide repeat protein n=1 Tax=Spirosoma sp. TaxID=1899569 RepID=UPI003B3B6FE0